MFVTVKVKRPGVKEANHFIVSSFYRLLLLKSVLTKGNSYHLGQCKVLLVVGLWVSCLTHHLLLKFSCSSMKINAQTSLTTEGRTLGRSVLQGEVTSALPLNLTHCRDNRELWEKG